MFAHAFKLRFGGKTVLDHLGANARCRQTTAIVTDFNENMTAFVARIERDMAKFRFASGAAFFRCFKTMIGRVADHMGERVFDRFKNLAVEFGVGPRHHQFDFLAQFLRQITHETRQFRPGIADGLHARLHDAFLQFRRHLIEALQGGGKGAIGETAQGLHQLIAREHKLADHVHQVFEHVDVNAQCLGLSLNGSSSR